MEYHLTMKITDVSIKEIKPYHDNPRVNNEAISVVKKSLSEYGFQQPLVVDKNNIIIQNISEHRQ